MKIKHNRYSGAKYQKIIFFIMILFSLTLILNINTYACTIFTKQQGNEILVGNNEDFNYAFESYVWLIAQKEGSYGRVCFANSSYVQGGMNEKGLFYDGAQCPATEIPHSKDKPTLGMDLGEVVLSKCSNVDEAVEFLKNNNIPSGYGDHILFADETGKSVIVEWVKGDMKIIPRELDYQVATNYFLSEPKLGGYPCKRYDTAKSMLEHDKEISIESFKNILSATSQAWNNGGTKYSNVYDLKNKAVYVFCKRDYSKYVCFNLINELKNIKNGEKKTYEVDKLEYKAFDNSSLNKNNVENVTSVSSDSLPYQTPQSYKSTEQTKNKLVYIIPVTLVILVFFVWLYFKSNRDKQGRKKD